MNKNIFTLKTTYFYWTLEKGKKSGMLKKTYVLDPNTKCLVIPYDPELLPLMLHQCIYFSVETDRNSQSIIVSYYYPKYEALKEKVHNYITTIGNVEVEKVSLVCEVDKMNFSDTRNKATVKTSFAFNMPEPVLEYALNEIRLMQKECFGFKPEKFYMKEYKIVHLLYSKPATITVELKKKAVNEELLKACIAYPSAPVLYYYLKHCDKYEFDRLDLLTNLDFCHKDDLKYFFEVQGIKYSKRFVRKTSTWWMNIPDLLFLLDSGFTSKKVIYYLLRHMQLLMEYRCVSGKEFLRKSNTEKGDKFTKKTLCLLNKMKMVVPEDMWKATSKEIINRKC